MENSRPAKEKDRFRSIAWPPADSAPVFAVRSCDIFFNFGYTSVLPPSQALSMRVIGSPSQMREVSHDLRQESRPLGLVPTMGALHDGHVSLVRRAVAECAAVIVSIFVNAPQFGPHEDLASYPRRLEEDLEICRKEGVAVVYSPSEEDVYPNGYGAWVEVPSLAEGLCGPHRPSHFRGVATIVTKLFFACTPDRAYFGEKDFQQLALVRRLADDLDSGVEIVSCPIVREPDGLAMSSRNAYLTGEERERALSLSRGLERARALFESGERDAGKIVDAARAELDRCNARVDYIEVVDSESLRPVKRVGSPARLAIAAHIGKTRLIDNMPLED